MSAGKKFWKVLLKILGAILFIGLLVLAAVSLILAKPAVQALKDYENQRKAGKEPTYNAEQNGITGTDFWRG